MNKMKELIMSKLTISCLCTRFRMVLSVLFLTLAAATNLHAQQKFPYGVVTANQPFGWAKTNNFSQIKDLVVDYTMLRSYKPAAELPSGIYFYELISGSFRSVKKSILLK
ncbi:MAG: hypothetical protein FMNOHCHN_00180 [Ignavibacteriaceae bacterium]|nr:hypothetical protein [Ignavibacteriaceae bacterium]